MRTFLLFLVVLALPASGAPTQSPPSLSERARVSMLTILPGDALYSAFGHSAIRVRDPKQGIDRIYNYGTFDYRDPFFVPKFMYGQLDYFLSVAGYKPAMRQYYALERPVIQQMLNLRPAQRQALFRFLEINARPENRFYRYDFLFDNCSTRVRDALEAALGDSVRFDYRASSPGTFRHLLDPYVRNRPWLDLGFDLMLGPPTDRKATPREAMFLPRYLMRAFDGATIRSSGEWKPLVTQRDTVFWVAGRSFAPPAAPAWPSLLFWTLLGLGVADALWRLYRRADVPHVADAVLFGAVGGTGLLMLFLWVIAEHKVTNQNWNLLWAWPTHLWAAWALARGVQRTPLQRYLSAAAGVAVVVVLGWFFWPQDLPSAALPLTLLLGVRAGLHAWYQTDQRLIPAGSGNSS